MRLHSDCGGIIDCIKIGEIASLGMSAMKSEIYCNRRSCPCSIHGGPRVHQLRQDCSEILDCDWIPLIALGGISLGLVVGCVEEMAGSWVVWVLSSKGPCCECWV